MEHLSKKQVTNDPGEKEWWDNYDPAKYPRPRVAVDIVILTVKDHALHTVLVERQHYPEKGLWALPGVFVREKETLEEAARRALSDKAHVQGVYLEQLYTFGAPDRDPRERVITVTYYALVHEAILTKSLDGKEHASLMPVYVPWKGESGGPVQVLDTNEPIDLAFDHDQILGMCIKRIRGKLAYMPIGFELVGKKFTLRELQQVYQAVLGTTLNKDSFRRKITQSGLVKSTGTLEKRGSHRPAELYQLKATKKKGAYHG